jgi:hypothetical protein
VMVQNRRGAIQWDRQQNGGRQTEKPIWKAIQFCGRTTPTLANAASGVRQ